MSGLCPSHRPVLSVDLTGASGVCLSDYPGVCRQTVPALLMALWCLANTPEAQQRLYREICSALPEGHQQEVTASAVNDIPFMRAVLKETLRLYPIGTEVSRLLDRDLQLGGYHIPAGVGDG